MSVYYSITTTTKPIIMKMQIEKTWLPIFPGFYGTIFEADESSEIQALNDERESNGLAPLTWNEYDQIGFNYADYQNEVGKCCTAVVCDELVSLGFINSYEYEAIDSPKEYNFRNDNINISVGYNKTNAKNLYKFVKANIESFTAHVKKHCSSYDGFISFHSNLASDWLEDTNNFQNFGDTYKLGFVLEWALISNLSEFRDNNVVLWLYDNIDDYSFISINDYHKATEMPYCTECKEFVEREDWISEVNTCKSCAMYSKTIINPIDIIAKGGDFVFDSETLCKVNAENGTDYKGLWELNGKYYGSPTSLPSFDVVLVSL